MTYELVVEIPRSEEDEALAIARDLSKTFATNVTIYEVHSGGTFADGIVKKLITTVECAS